MKTKLIYSVMGTAIAASATTAIVLPIVITKTATERAKEKIGELIALEGPANSLETKQKINYVAVGDSVTAGYNGFLAGRPTSTSTGETTSPLGRDENGMIIEGTTTSDYLSYADFVAESLKEQGRLNDYRNFARSGDKIPDVNNTLFRNTTALKALQNADLVTVSIGANDLLSAVELLRLPFSAVFGMLSGGEASFGNAISELNTAREKLTDILDLNSAARPTSTGASRSRDASPSGYASREDVANLIRESFDLAYHMFETGSWAGLINIRQEMLDKIFKIIELDLSTLLRKINSAAPQAKIVLVGYAFPFHLFPDSMVYKPIPSYTVNKKIEGGAEKTVGEEVAIDQLMLNGKPANMDDVFKEFMNTYQKIADRANFVEFFNINNLKEFTKNADSVSYTLSGVSDSDAAIYKENGWSSVNAAGTNLWKNDEELNVSEWDRVMPNILDIHPSTYGHQVIGGHMLEWMGRNFLGMKSIPKYESIQKLNPATDKAKIEALDKIYTYAGVDEGFDILDETRADKSTLGEIMANMEKVQVNPSKPNDKAMTGFDGLVSTIESLTPFMTKIQIFTTILGGLLGKDLSSLNALEQ